MPGSTPSSSAPDVPRQTSLVPADFPPLPARVVTREGPSAVGHQHRSMAAQGWPTASSAAVNGVPSPPPSVLQKPGAGLVVPSVEVEVLVDPLLQPLRQQLGTLEGQMQEVQRLLSQLQPLLELTQVVAHITQQLGQVAQVVASLQQQQQQQPRQQQQQQRLVQQRLGPGVPALASPQRPPGGQARPFVSVGNPSQNTRCRSSPSRSLTTTPDRPPKYQALEDEDEGPGDHHDNM